MSPLWASQGIRGDISSSSSGLPSILDRIAIAKTEPGDENKGHLGAGGEVDIRKLGEFEQNDPDAYSYSGALCKANQGLMEFVEMFKAPIKVLHPLLTATQEGNYNGTEAIGGIPFDGVVLAHSNEAEWQNFKTNKNNEAFIDRVYIVKVPYCLRVSEEVKIYEKLITGSSLRNAPCAPDTLKMLAQPRASIFSR
jgi:serine protein kinase